MKKYTIQFSETHVKEITIKATSEKAAKEQFLNGYAWSDYEDDAILLDVWLEDDYQIVSTK